VHQTKEPEHKDDFDEWLARIICFAFSVPPQWATKVMNRATADNQSAQSEEEGLEPTKEWVKDLIDEIIGEEFASPDLELVWLDEDTDASQAEAQLESRVKLGAVTLNELRDSLGHPYVNTAADRPMVLTATGYMPIEANAGGQGAPAVQKYSPDQPRVPAGNSDGGQWMSEGAAPAAANDDPRGLSDLTPDNTWIPGAQYAANWPHHYIPWATFRKLPLQDETRQVFVDATSGPLADTRANRWSPEHKAYNDAVDDAFRSYLERNNIAAEQMTQAQADEFVDEIFYSRDPRIRSFNRRIWSEAFRYWRRSGGRGGAMRNKMAVDEPNSRDQEQAEVFESLRDRVFNLLERFGRPDYLPAQPNGDYSVHGDYAGYPELVVFVSNLQMLRPPVVTALQELVKEFPGWQITVTIAVREHYDDWPHMGLYIRPHEIIDGLQRQYFSKEFQDLKYEGARTGTAYD
jgi:hypothetical protein